VAHTLHLAAWPLPSLNVSVLINVSSLRNSALLNNRTLLDNSNYCSSSGGGARPRLMPWRVSTSIVLVGDWRATGGLEEVGHAVYDSRAGEGGFEIIQRVEAGGDDLDATLVVQGLGGC